MAKKTLALSLALLALLCLPFAVGAFAAPDDKPAARDDALDDLLKKVEEKESSTADKPAPRGDSAPDAEKPSGEVSSKDKDLDSLLEKLGTTHDKPAAEDRRPGGPPGEPRPGDEPPPSQPDDEKKPGESSGALKGKDKDLDEHLEEAAGKRRKKKQGDGQGPLSQVIKEMDEVKERLGKPDTGEETRKKQEQIVKKIETLIEQAKRSESQSQSKKKSMAMRKGKPRPGKPEDGEQTGNTGGNAPFTKPQKPTDRRSLAGGKELWGDLPPEVRQDLDNVMKEGFLPSREELIRRYYLSLSKKKATRGE